MKSKVNLKMWTAVFTVLLFAVSGCEVGVEVNNPGVLQEYPGGAMWVQVYTSATPYINVIVTFDPDITAMNGNETHCVISMAPYYAVNPQGGGFIDHSFTWYADNVEPGSYFVYAWLDMDGDAEMDDDQLETNLVWVYSKGIEYTFAGIGFDLIYRQGIGEPNYTFWEEFAPEIDFLEIQFNGF